MNDYKRGTKLVRRLSKREIRKLKTIQTYSSLFIGENLCGIEGPSCNPCCFQCRKLKLCYESWLNDYVRICINKANKTEAWCSCVNNYINRELKKEN